MKAQVVDSPLDGMILLYFFSLLVALLVAVMYFADYIDGL